ncbi:uncharacterized protein LOC143236580 [Tachypleus tridentatus]|uniref:uncharacterized protein LOC143236580 n=2 Tax=Tachypleus tridentatus TaxID=6853 RepID=UPI003FD1657E
MTPATPSDEETAKFLMDLASRTITDDSPVWLGLSQEETVNNSAFINLWGTSQPQTVENGKVAMKRSSSFKWEITDSHISGWSLCEIPKADVSYCVKDTCYNVYPTALTNIEAVYMFCELIGGRAAIPQTPELAKQVATYLEKMYLIAATGVFLNGTLLTDENQNVIGNSDDWPFITPPLNKDLKCVLLLRGYFFKVLVTQIDFFPCVRLKLQMKKMTKTSKVVENVKVVVVEKARRVGDVDVKLEINCCCVKY